MRILGCNHSCLDNSLQSYLGLWTGEAAKRACTAVERAGVCRLVCQTCGAGSRYSATSSCGADCNADCR
jgi:hypothetical protein